MLCTSHSLLLRVSFVEKVALYVKAENERQCFQPALPHTCKGEVEGFVTGFSISQISRLLAQVVAKSPDWQGMMHS